MATFLLEFVCGQAEFLAAIFSEAEELGSGVDLYFFFFSRGF